jgi:hypothetical protein
MHSVTDEEKRASLLAFFEYLFRYDEGYLVLATTRPPAKRDTFNERFFAWPSEKESAVEFIDSVTMTHNVYFCVNIMSAKKRVKANAIPQNLVWADLDACRPDQLEHPPQCVIESSPHRYQAIWRLDHKIDPTIAENYSKRLAYFYANLGVDKSGWDNTQLLRVPGTYNYKYQMEEPPSVRLLAKIELAIPSSTFDLLPQPDGTSDVPDIKLPNVENLPSADMIIYRYQEQLRHKELATIFARYYTEEPVSDWSGALWRLLLLCFELGMTAEEVYVIAKNAKCNKYERDGRPDSHLWREIIKAELEQKSLEVLLSDHKSLVMPALLSAKEESLLKPTIIDDYMEWAKDVTDAVPDFHEISCSIVMSALMATTVRLPRSRGQSIVPNLWAMILGETSLTRKTTAMDMAMDFVMDVDRDLILASDATAEGLMASLALRPKMVSIFYRDEVTGFFDAINRKEYLASLPEMMTKMYDVPKYMVRKLRRESFVVSEPIFIFFGGGVPNKMFSLIEESYFASGFIPRFLIMRGHQDTANLKFGVDPPAGEKTDKRTDLLSTFRSYYNMYTDQQVTVELHDGQKMISTPDIMVSFPPAFYERAALMEQQLTEAASDSSESDKALPMFTRMFTSMIKLSMLFAASRQEPKDYKIEGTLDDLLNAAYYIQKWGKHAVDLIQNSGITSDESKTIAVYKMVEKRPGIMRGDVMRHHRLNARVMDIIEDTLVQRNMMSFQRKGKAKTYWPIGV